MPHRAVLPLPERRGKFRIAGLWLPQILLSGAGVHYNLALTSEQQPVDLFWPMMGGKESISQSGVLHLKTMNWLPETAVPRVKMMLPREGMMFPREGMMFPREGMMFPREGTMFPREGMMFPRVR